MKKYQKYFCFSVIAFALFTCAFLSFLPDSQAQSEAIQSQNKTMTKEKVNTAPQKKISVIPKENVTPSTQEKINPIPQQKISPVPQQKINQIPKQAPGTSLPNPLPPGLGVNLRITDLSINNNDGRVTATVENVAPSAMKFDAKIRLRRDNVLVKECLWPKTVKKMFCSVNMLIRNVPGADPNMCNLGKGDYEIHAEIIPDLAEPQIDKSGRDKRGMLNARQDLYAAYFYEDTITKKIGIVVGNKGPCYATPWSYKFYIDGNLIETGPLFSGGMKRNEYSHNLLQSQNVFTQSARRQSRFKFEVVPQYPEHEQSTGNNVYEVQGLSVAEAAGIDIAVTDIKFLGEYYQDAYPNANYVSDGDYYFKILPYIKNIGTSKYPDGAILKTQFFVDNVSVMEKDCYPGLAPGAEMAVSYCFASDSNLPTLPAGSHTVRFVVTTLDGNIYNNHLVKTMVRP
jgi:hypothetical protein